MTTAGQDLTYSGTQVLCVIKEQNDCIDYTPLRVQGTNLIWYTVGYQGVLMVSSAFLTTHYLTFASLIAEYNNLVAWVVNMETGELRYYDGTQAGDEDVFIDPLYDSMICTGADHSPVRTTDSMPGAGQVEPMDIKQKNIEYSFSIDRAYSPRWKTDYAANVPAAVTTATRIKNPIGFTGMDAILDRWNVDEAKQDGNTPYFLVMFYARDSSNAAGQIGVSDIYLCSKIESPSPKYTADGIYVQNIKGKSLSRIHAPRDTYQSYTYDDGEQ